MSGEEKEAGPRIFIIHFAPVELYPPVQNFLRHLDTKDDVSKIQVITTTPVVNLPVFATKNIRIIRRGKSSRHFGAYKRYINYLAFYLSCLRLLVYYRPGKVLYYETLSSFPVYIYKKLVNRNAAIFIHYHEYTSKEEYEHGMLLARAFHKMEKHLYPIASSVSHTNALRMEKFKQDISPVIISKPFIFPNYPPSLWRPNGKREPGLPLRIIYAGALSLKTMHTEKFAEWILGNKGDVIWDIYSLNYTDDAAHYISSLDSPWIRLKGSIEYSKLPTTLAQYDVGIILYNGHIPNYIYNAPNKLFEYLACGLDVWFPIEMIGCHEYITEKKFPRVAALDFQNLSQMDLRSLLSRDELAHQSSSFYCEPIYEKLYNVLSEF